MDYKFEDCYQNNCMDPNAIPNYADRLCANTYPIGRRYQIQKSCDAEFSPCSECVINQIFDPLSINSKFENVINFTVNVFGESSKVADVPSEYISIYSQNFNLSHFPTDFDDYPRNPNIENDPVFKYKHSSTIESKINLTENNIEIIQKDLTNIVCTGQTQQLPDTLGK